MVPVVEALAGQVRVSIDTRKAAVAEAAVAAGADIINDVSASLWPVAADAGVGWVAMHMRGDPTVMQPLRPLRRRRRRGPRPSRSSGPSGPRRPGSREVWIDPGIGFAKTAGHNLLLLAPPRHAGRHRMAGRGRHQPQDASSGGWRPARAGEPAPADDRSEARVATAAWAMSTGRAVVRVHDVAPAVHAARLMGCTSTRERWRAMKGKWAKGIPPRFFAWIIKGKLAVSERPGGYARNHRQVRRQEEILWLRSEGFTRVVSLLPSPHNLHAYDELGVAWAHMPFGPHDDPAVVLPDLYARLRDGWPPASGSCVHQEELSDRLMGVVAGYLPLVGHGRRGPQAIAVVEKILAPADGPGRPGAGGAGPQPGRAAQRLGS